MKFMFIIIRYNYDDIIIYANVKFSKVVKEIPISIFKFQSINLSLKLKYQKNTTLQHR